jgi:hypothetical protein
MVGWGIGYAIFSINCERHHINEERCMHVMGTIDVIICFHFPHIATLLPRGRKKGIHHLSSCINLKYLIITCKQDSYIISYYMQACCWMIYLVLEKSIIDFSMTTHSAIPQRKPHDHEFT